MSDIVEIVARAMCSASRERQRDHEGAADHHAWVEEMWAEWVPDTRAALTALEAAGYVVVRQSEIDHLNAVIVQLGDDLGAANTV